MRIVYLCGYLDVTLFYLLFLFYTFFFPTFPHLLLLKFYYILLLFFLIFTFYFSVFLFYFSFYEEGDCTVPGSYLGFSTQVCQVQNIKYTCDDGMSS